MKKITLLFTAFFLAVVIKSFAQQVTVEVIAYPTEFTVDNSDPAVFGPSAGQDPLVVIVRNIPDATLITNSAPAPIRAASAVQTGLGSITIPSNGDFTGLLGSVFNPGPPNFGFTDLHQVTLNDPASVSSTYTVSDNGNGTFDARLIHTRFTQASAYQEGDDYIVVQRTFVADPGPGGLPVKPDGSGGYEIAPMTYVAASEIESVATLTTKGNTAITLNTKNFSKNKLTAFYNASTKAIVTNDAIGERFSIYNLTGQSVLEGKVSKEISVETLKPGLYILSTKLGSLKFVR